jgi:mono/diheme cytochrome c family protein
MKRLHKYSTGAILVSLALLGAPAAEAAGTDPEAGQAIYDKQCASCHGADGKGASSMPGIPDLADPARMAKKTDRELLQIIVNGKEGTRMPPWGRVLDERDRKNVLSFIRSLSGAKSR